MDMIRSIELFLEDSNWNNLVNTVHYTKNHTTFETFLRSLYKNAIFYFNETMSIKEKINLSNQIRGSGKIKCLCRE